VASFAPRPLQPDQFFIRPELDDFGWLNRAELGEFDALVLGLLLIGHFKGQLVIPDFGFYGREAHVSLIKEDRLIAAVNFLGELSSKLRNDVLLIKDRHASGATAEATYTSKFRRASEGFAADAMGVSEG
jgi:hypothetical protein